jgi:two-component system sensor histidine kinase HupT/HoxJ
LVDEWAVVKTDRPQTPFEASGAPAEAEQAWIAVIHKMDETYADLVAQQVALEEKNAALEEAQGFIAGVMGSMTDVLIACDLEGRIEQVNLAAERMLDRPARELVARRLADLLDEASPTTFEDVRRTAEHRGRIVDRELVFATPDGPFPISVNSSIRFDTRGRAVGIVLVGRPIGELRRAYRELATAHERLKETQQQLVQSEKMASLGRLVAGVAHELNNPISFVYGNAHAMRRYAAGLVAYLEALHAGADRATLDRKRSELKIDRSLADIEGTLDGIFEGAERVRDIVADLRRFSSDRKEVREPFDLAAVLRAAVAWVVAAQAPDLDIHFALPDDFFAVGHPGHVHQVAMNLVQNAVDAMEGAPRRRLEVVGRREGAAVVATIRDSGPGIPDDVLPRIFDPFFTTKPVGKGTGLGLSISYRIVQEHGGTLSGRTHPEGGAELALVLPAADARQERR